MTQDEKDQFFQQMHRAAANAKIIAALEREMTRRKISVMRRVYTEMGFEVDDKGLLASMPSIPTTARFVEIDPDFYDYS